MRLCPPDEQNESAGDTEECGRGVASGQGSYPLEHPRQLPPPRACRGQPRRPPPEPRSDQEDAAACTRELLAARITRTAEQRSARGKRQKTQKEPRERYSRSRSTQGGEGKRNSHTGTRTRVCWVRASYPNRLDYMGTFIHNTTALITYWTRTDPPLARHCATPAAIVPADHHSLGGVAVLRTSRIFFDEAGRQAIGHEALPSRRAERECGRHRGVRAWCGQRTRVIPA